MKRVFFPALLMAVLCSCLQAANEIDLSGEWAFALDPGDAGISEQWYNRPLEGKIRLPGSLQEHGYGFDVGIHTQWTGQVVDNTWYHAPEYAKYREPGNVKIPFWLQPDKHYIGVAWYQKEVNVPSSWKGRHVELELERTHWETALYVNGKEIGKSDALLTPHRYVIEETGKLLLTLRVDNRVHIPVGINAHSVSDHTQSNWNGIIGKIVLSARPALRINAVRVYPDVQAKKAKVEIDIAGKATGKVRITLKAKSFNSAVSAKVKPVSVETDGGRAVAILDMGEGMLTWSEYEPNLYRLDVTLKSESGTDAKTVDFGMREFKASGTRFTVNGTPVFLRGTLECCIFPLTGYPSTDVAYWEKIYRRCREFGLNHVRFHSWCPPEVAFEVADRTGIYLQVECGGWTEVGDGGRIDEWFYEESERIVREYGNHPSFCMMLYGNEPGGRKQVEYLSKFVDHWKAKDGRRVYTGGAGWPYLPNADYWNTPDPRIQAWGGGLRSIINAKPPQTAYDWREIIKDKNMPVVSHEIGQWCVYPDFGEIPKYSGVLKAKNFEIFRETLEKNHLGDMAGKFLYASGRLQTLCYKADIEAALRTPGFAGFQLLDLHDFPGQGTALVGVLDPFWDEKGYVTGAEYSRFCNGLVPLARMEKLIWTNGETFHASIEAAHFAARPFPNATVEWELTDAAKQVLAKGKTTKDLPVNNGIEITRIECDLSAVKEPAQLTLTVGIAGEKYASNSWHVWVYPVTEKPIDSKPYFTTDFDEAAARVQSGDRVLYCPPAAALKPEKGGSIAVGFSSIFWNTAWTRKQPPHTLGICCDPAHPSLAAFPNDGYSDYQWHDIVTGSAPLLMDGFPASLRPTVYLIDDWFTNRRLGLLFEAKAGKGKLMVCGADLSRDSDSPAMRQFRRSIEQYMASDKFNPAEEIDMALIKEWLKYPPFF
ncbi:MAG: beta-galactosidase [Prevotellaceae bacterium]|nr:beta-galactosidase [Prevotellaceae bacterium]